MLVQFVLHVEYVQRVSKNGRWYKSVRHLHIEWAVSMSGMAKKRRQKYEGGHRSCKKNVFSENNDEFFTVHTAN